VVDYILLSSILQELSGVQTEFKDQLVALMFGTLTSGQTSNGEVKNDQSSELDRVGQPFKCGKNKTEILVSKNDKSEISSSDLFTRKHLKNKKNKTENLIEKLTTSRRIQNKGSEKKSRVMKPSSVKRKTSLVHKFSNLFIN